MTLLDEVSDDAHLSDAEQKEEHLGSVDYDVWACQSCGDVMKLQLKLDDDERIVDVKFKTYGCGSAIASSTMFVEMLKGRTIEEAKQVKDKDIAEALELPPIKLHCSVLAEDSIKQAIEDWEKKKAHRQHNYYPDGGDID